MDDTDEPRFEITPEARAKLDKIIATNPEAASQIREMFANMRQAQEGMRSGKYTSFEEAMEKITGKRPQTIAIGVDERC